MKIIITAQEALNKGIWPEAAELTGYDISALSEGMSVDTEIVLSTEQAVRLGLIMIPSNYYI